MATKAPADKNLAEKRAEAELFEFRVPSEGRVLVTNTTYNDDENHRYVVTVEDGEAVSCTCAHFEHRNPGPENDKHCQAVNDQPAVLQAASTERGQ